MREPRQSSVEGKDATLRRAEAGPIEGGIGSREDAADTTEPAPPPASIGLPSPSYSSSKKAGATFALQNRFDRTLKD